MENTGGQINSVDCHWMTKIDRPPWIIVCMIRDCTASTGAVTSMTTTVVGIMSWKSVQIDTALIGRSV